MLKDRIVEQEARAHLVSRIRNDSGRRARVRVGAPDPSRIGNGGMAAVTELLNRLDVIRLLNAAVSPIKQRDRGFGAGQLLVGLASAQLAGQDSLVGLASAQLAGQDSLVGLDRVCADSAGQKLVPVAGFASITAAGLARGRVKKLTDRQVRDLADRAAAGEVKALLAKEFGISRETVYAYLRAAHAHPVSAVGRARTLGRG